MKKIFFFTVFLLLLFTSNSRSQHTALFENFETSGLNNVDSLPTNWLEFDEDNSNPGYPNAKWKARDTSANFPGVNAIYHSRAYLSHRSLSIPWRSGDPVADDWVFTDTVHVQTGDTLIFWMLYGAPDSTLVGFVPSNYIDSMKVYVSATPLPNVGNTLLSKLVSLDSANVWQEFKFSLSAFAGQTIYVAFRYHMNTTVDGLWCNIDNVFVGNRSPIGIHQISTDVPKRFELKQNYPNPFNPTTNLEFDLPKAENVKIVLYNAMGQEVRTLLNEYKSAGSYKIDFNASSLASGPYFYRIYAGNFVDTKKMILVK